MRIKPTDRQIVVDLETLSSRPNSCIISIGAVAFTLQDGITEEFLINVDPVTCKEVGLHISKETIQWWSTQSKEAIDSWKKDPVPLQPVHAGQNALCWAVERCRAHWPAGRSADGGPSVGHDRSMGCFHIDVPVGIRRSGLRPLAPAFGN